MKMAENNEDFQISNLGYHNQNQQPNQRPEGQGNEYHNWQ
jgi:hypothetical protein